MNAKDERDRYDGTEEKMAAEFEPLALATVDGIKNDNILCCQLFCVQAYKMILYCCFEWLYNINIID